MPRALSTDIRARAVAYVQAGHSRRGAADKLAISASSAVRFAARHAQTGDLSPKTGRRGPRPKLDEHREFLFARIKEEPDITMHPFRLRHYTLNTGKKTIIQLIAFSLVSARQDRAGK